MDVPLLKEALFDYSFFFDQSDPPTSVEKARDIVAELELAIKRLHLGRVQLRSNPSVQLSSGATNPGLLTYRGVSIGIHHFKNPYLLIFLFQIQRFGATTSSYHLNRSRTRFPRYHRNEFETPLKHLSAECVFHMADGKFHIFIVVVFFSLQKFHSMYLGFSNR